MKTSLCFILALLSLPGCVNVAVTGAQAAYSHHNIQTSLNDHYIAIKAEREIYLDTNRFDNTNVSVVSFNGIVLLTGQVKTIAQRHEIEKIVKDLPNVKEVHDVIDISTPTSSLTRVSDTWITTKIKSKLIAMKDIDPNQIKVVTENGIAYLMGTVLPEQADIAIDIAKSTDGVQGVVKVFSYIHISKHSTIS